MGWANELWEVAAVEVEEAVERSRHLVLFDQESRKTLKVPFG